MLVLCSNNCAIFSDKEICGIVVRTTFETLTILCRMCDTKSIWCFCRNESYVEEEVARVGNADW